MNLNAFGIAPRPWTKVDEQALYEMAKFGFLTDEIAESLGRSEDSINAKAWYLRVSIGQRDPEWCIQRRIEQAALHPSGWSRP